jgi:hypothetical protein
MKDGKMTRLSLLTVVLAGVLLQAAAACVGGPEGAQLNPQPLPPRTDTDQEDEAPSRAPPEGSGGSTSGSSSSGSSGSAAPSYGTDAGTAGDAAGDAG